MLNQTLHEAELTNRACLKLGGDDVVDFLQNLITCDVEELATGALTFGALLSPQGKILYEFFLLKTEDGFLLDCPKLQVDELLKRLMFYRLRAAVTLEKSDLKVVAKWGGTVLQASAHTTAQDPRNTAMGWRSYLDQPDGSTFSNTEQDWEAHRIRTGFAAIFADYEPGSAFPHDVLMDEFGGVDFSKGCYVGQEVVSRMQHRGTARNRLVCLQTNEAAPLPDKGTEITAGGKTIGTMGSSQGDSGLAIARTDRVIKALAAGDAITAGDAQLTISPPDYATYAWAD